MKHGLDWYKRYPVDYLGGVQGMTSKEHAVYSVVLDLIYLHGGPINNDPSWVAGWIKDMGSSSVRNTINSLILKLKLYEIDGQIMQKRAENEVKTKQNQSETNKKSGRLGGVLSGKSRRAPSKNNDLAEANGSTTSEAIREEKRREENKEKNSPSKGSRIKENWGPSDKLIKAIAEKEQTTNDWVQSQVYSFVNYWLGISGVKSIKASWDATFRKWCNKSYDKKPKSNGHAYTPPSRWQTPLENFALYGEWSDEFCGEHKPTIDGEYNPKCKAPRELIEQIVIKNKAGQ